MAISWSSAGYATPRADLGEAFLEYEAEPGTFIAEDVLAPFDSKKKAAKFAARLRGSILQNVDTKRAARGNFNRIDSRAKDVAFECETHGLEGVVDDEERELYASDFDAELATVMDVGMAVKIAKERRAAAALIDTATWTGATLYTDVSGSNPWGTISSDLLGTVLDAGEKVRQLTGMRANALIISAATLVKLLKNTAIRGQFPGAPSVTLKMIRDNLPAIFGLDYLFVGGAVYDTAAEGASSPSLSDVWSASYAMVARVARPGSRLSSPCVGRTIRWADFDAAMAVQMYREEQTMGNVLRVLECVDELVIDPSFGHLLKIA